MDKKKTSRVSSLRFWRFIFPIVLLIVLLASIFFIMTMPDTLVFGSSAPIPMRSNTPNSV
jgi:hypothetical protein